MRRLGPIVVLGLALIGAACSSTTDSVAGSEQATASESEATPEPESETETASSETTEDPEATVPTGAGLSVDEQAAFDAAVTQFMDDRSVSAAREAVQFMVQSGDRGYAPWLVDLAQMGLSNLLADEVTEALAALMDLEPTGDNFVDFGRAGSAVETEGIEPAAGYRQWKLSIFERLDPEFLPLLESVSDQERFNRIRYGGVRRGGIPELNDPVRISATEALEWITDDEIVLGIELNGEVVAYPFRIIGHHELINDTVGGLPVSAVYCTLCRTGLLFDRRVAGADGSDEQLLDFQTSGMLINSNKIMVDRQTDTLWHHAAGLGIGGQLEGVTLSVFPMETTTWSEWYARHPNTEVLEIPGPIFFEDPERPPITYPYEPGGAYSAYYDDPTTWFPIRSVSDALDPKAEVIGIGHGGGRLAISVEEIASGPTRYFAVGDGGVVVAPTTSGARVYAARPEALVVLADMAQGSEVALASLDGEGATLAQGETLERIAVEQGFWFSWYDRHPATEVWPS